MSPSSKHEHVAKLIERMVDLLSIRQRIKVLFYGSATLKKQSEQKGAEPDACFYVQTADLVGNERGIDFETDPPPDVVVEIDIHHESISKFPIYSALRGSGTVALRRRVANNLSLARSAIYSGRREPSLAGAHRRGANGIPRSQSERRSIRYCVGVSGMADGSDRVSSNRSLDLRSTLLCSVDLPYPSPALTQPSSPKHAAASSATRASRDSRPRPTTPGYAELLLT